MAKAWSTEAHFINSLRYDSQSFPVGTRILPPWYWSPTSKGLKYQNGRTRVLQEGKYFQLKIRRTLHMNSADKCNIDYNQLFCISWSFNKITVDRYIVKRNLIIATAEEMQNRRICLITLNTCKCTIFEGNILNIAFIL